MARKPAPGSKPAPKPALTLTYEVTERDIAAFHDYHLWRHSRRAPVALGMIAVLGVFTTLITGKRDPLVTALLAGLVPMIAFFWTMHHSRQRMIRLGRQTGILGTHILELSSRGFRQHRGDGREIKRTWSDPVQVAETPRHIFVYVNPTQAVIVPRTAFSTPEEAERFLANLREWTRTSG